MADVGGVNPRTVIISDTHLGRPRGAAVSADALRPLWQGATRFIVNGDVAEVHHPRYRGAAARQVLRLQELCEEDDVNLRLLSGNHDALLTDVRHMYLGHRFVLVTHGDAIHPAIAPWSPSAALMRAAYFDAVNKLDAHPRSGALEQRLSAAQHAGFTEWNESRHAAPRWPLLELVRRPWMIRTILAYWKKMPTLGAQFLTDHAPQARFLVIGHTHREGIWRVGDRMIINTGCFGFPGHPRAAVLEEDKLTVHPIVFRNGAYRMDEKPLASFDVTAPAPKCETWWRVAA